MASVREFDPIFRPLSFSDRARKAIELTHKIRSHAHRRTAHLSKGHKVLITAVAIAAFFFLTLVVPSAATAGSIAFGFWKLDQAQHQASSFDFTSARSSASSAAAAFNLASGEAAELQLPLSLIGHQRSFAHLNNFLSTQEHLSNSLSKLSDAADSISSLAGSLVVTDVAAQVNSSNTSATLSSASVSLKDSIDQLKIAQSQEPLSHSTLTSILGFNPTLSSYLAALQQSQTLLYQIINFWPEATSLNGEKRYLILVSDSHALNSGGGKIVGAGLLNFQQGKLRSITFDDVPFTNLSGSGFQNFLGKSGINLATISASPDYASYSSALLKASADGNLAGVITLDDHALSSILNIIGPVHPAGYQLEINSINVTQLAHAQLNHDPASHNLLTSTASEVISKIFNHPTQSVRSISQALLTSVTTKHLLATFSSPALNSLAIAHNWNGQLTPEKVLGASTSSVSDFLMTDIISNQNESGKWQSNFQIDYTPTVTSTSQVESHLTLTLTNTSASPTDDIYQESFKIYVPAGSTLINSSSPVVSDQDSGFTTFAIPFSIAPKGSVTVSLTYNLPKYPSFPTNYLLQVNKQISSSSSLLQLHLQAPPNVKVIGPQGSYQINHDSNFHFTLTH